MLANDPNQRALELQLSGVTAGTVRDAQELRAALPEDAHDQPALSPITSAYVLLSGSFLRNHTKPAPGHGQWQPPWLHAGAQVLD